MNNFLEMNLSKKNILIAIGIVLLLILVMPYIMFAQGGGSGGSSNGGGGGSAQTVGDQDQDREQDRLRDQDCVAGTDCEPQQDRDRDRLQIQTPDELRTTIQDQQRLMLGAQDGASDAVQTMNRNQNQVRVAAQALIASEDILGDIGPAVAKIARDFDNSVQTTVQAEEQIHNRSRLARFFFGSDGEVVRNFEGQINQNQERMRDLNQLMQGWDGDDQVKDLLQEQVRNMEQEQQRLQQIVDDESKSRGLFGFLFGWL